jgi:HD-GYP domain-containing protein (c-di-GMP phosphodiesterase class II)
MTATKRLVYAVALAAILVAAILFRVAPGLDENSLRSAAFFAFLGLLAHSLSYALPRDLSGNISFIPSLSAVVVAPTFAVTVGVAIAVLLSELIKRREPLKALFNVAQYALAISTASLVFISANSGTTGTVSRYTVIPMIAAFASFLLVNTASVSGVISVSRNQPFLEVFRHNTKGAVLYDMFAIPVVYAFAYVYVRYGPVSALGVSVPLFGLRQLYKTNWQLERVNEELLQIMVAAIEARDPYTSGHSQRVSVYSRIVAKAAGLSDRATDRVATAALLHDVGKIHEEFAPILRKPGRLTAEEFAVMKTHSEKGATLVSKVSQFTDLVPAIRSHHEAWDGTGYPNALRGEEIPLAARVIALADTIDAMTTDRPYRAALTESAVREEIKLQLGHQFDPIIAASLISDSKWAPMARALSAREGVRRATPLSMPAIPRHSATFPVQAP